MMFELQSWIVGLKGLRAAMLLGALLSSVVAQNISTTSSAGYDDWTRTDGFNMTSWTTSVLATNGTGDPNATYFLDDATTTIRQYVNETTTTILDRNTTYNISESITYSVVDVSDVWNGTSSALDATSSDTSTTYVSVNDTTTNIVDMNTDVPEITTYNISESTTYNVVNVSDSTATTARNIIISESPTSMASGTASVLATNENTDVNATQTNTYIPDETTTAGNPALETTSNALDKNTDVPDSTTESSSEITVVDVSDSEESTSNDYGTNGFETTASYASATGAFISESPTGMAPGTTSVFATNSDVSASQTNANIPDEATTAGNPVLETTSTALDRITDVPDSTTESSSEITVVDVSDSEESTSNDYGTNGFETTASYASATGAFISEFPTGMAPGTTSVFATNSDVSASQTNANIPDEATTAGNPVLETTSTALDRITDVPDSTTGSSSEITVVDVSDGEESTSNDNGINGLETTASYASATGGQSSESPTDEISLSPRTSVVDTTTADIDECLTNEAMCEQICVNEADSFRCECEAGYLMLNMYSCQDINECAANPAPCEENCTNTNGSYDCSCNGNKSLGVDNYSCLDCPVVCDHRCTPFASGPACTCPAGYQLSAPASCIELDAIGDARQAVTSNGVIAVIQIRLDTEYDTGFSNPALDTTHEANNTLSPQMADVFSAIGLPAGDVSVVIAGFFPGSLGVTIHLQSATLTLSGAEILELGQQLSEVLATTNFTLPDNETVGVQGITLFTTDAQGNVLVVDGAELISPKCPLYASLSLCQNGGQCTEQGGQAICSCTSSTSGTYCSNSNETAPPLVEILVPVGVILLLIIIFIIVFVKVKKSNRFSRQSSSGQSRQRLTGSATSRRRSASSRPRSRNSILPMTYEEDPDVAADLVNSPALSYEEAALKNEVVEKDIYGDDDVANMGFPAPPPIAQGHGTESRQIQMNVDSLA